MNKENIRVNHKKYNATLIFLNGGAQKTDSRSLSPISDKDTCFMLKQLCTRLMHEFAA